jgi:superfamily II DNA or RNA helicase
VTVDELVPGARVTGLVAGVEVSVLAVQRHGADAATVTYRGADGALGERVVYAADLSCVLVASSTQHRPFDADGADFRLAAEAQRIAMAGMSDPMSAVATSDVEPLPHQIRAVYGELLPRTPLRFLLADDPGAGKTIMAGLYVKELLLRGDVARCLIVAPGGLVEQWQDELAGKFGLDFEILGGPMLDEPSVLERHPLLIARMDQLARNDDLVDSLRASEWDLVVVDEAHRMAARYYGGELATTRRYQLGQVLGDVARHLLLMTATPHAGKEEDFQLFLALLDPDRFEGRFRPGVHSADTAGLMRRMIKEDLLTFEGKPLFPERVAQTVPYELSPLEAELYAEVTHYVREEMNRADRLDPSRRTTVGFALTVLQRRLASSPEAIYRSLQRRQARLRRRRSEMLDPTTIPRDDDLARGARDLDDPDELDAEQTEELEEELVDAATTARTVAELDTELVLLGELEALAARVRAAREDRKWAELRTILQDEALTTDRDGHPRKLIVFTEHRDTLDYLTGRIRQVLGRDDAVVAIHGGVRRGERRRVTEEFTHDPVCRVLVATDAAGEGLNLQRAHLMVNYDLPWNPNRLEQRFGRIHRIGQREVCRLWNLVASDTREGEVFTRLLDKVEEQRKAYGGKVFDVLGDAFAGRPLRELLVEAIRYGDQPEVRARLDEVIDSDVATGLRELLEQHALSGEMLKPDEVDRLRRDMDEARARRLQPHYVELFFVEAFKRLGGRISRREAGRHQITHVPAALRERQTGVRTPVATRYERVTFDPDRIRLPGAITADLLAPGHPLLDAVVATTSARHADVLQRGAVLVDERSVAGSPPRLLVAVEQTVADGLGDVVARRFGYAWSGRDGSTESAGVAPYLDLSPGDGALPDVGWATEAEAAARDWVIRSELPAYQRQVGDRVTHEVERTTAAVTSRLRQEINRLYAEASQAEEQEAHGRAVRVRPATLVQRAEALEARRERRLSALSGQAQLVLRPPRVVGAALVVAPAPGVAPTKDTRAVERRGVDAVLAAERTLGREPEEMPPNNPGYDVRSQQADGHDLHLEVKARVLGAEDFTITYNEVLHAKNAAPRYRLALVSVHPDGPQHDELRYLESPFGSTDLGTFAATRITGDWAATWARGGPPF